MRMRENNIGLIWNHFINRNLFDAYDHICLCNVFLNNSSGLSNHLVITKELGQILPFRRAYPGTLDCYLAVRKW